MNADLYQDPPPPTLIYSRPITIFKLCQLPALGLHMCHLGGGIKCIKKVQDPSNLYPQKHRK